MKTKFFKFSDLVDFVNSQKDDRFIEMTGEQVLDCGCVLTHFGRHKTHRKITSVGFGSISIENKKSLICDEDADKCYGFISHLINRNVKNYKMAKRILKMYL